MRQSLIWLRNKLFGVNAIEQRLKAQQNTLLESFSLAQQKALLESLSVVQQDIKEKLNVQSTESHLALQQIRVEIDEVKQQIDQKNNQLAALIAEQTSSFSHFKTKYFPDTTYESFDVSFLARAEAGRSSALFFNTYLYHKPCFKTDLDLLDHVLPLVAADDLALEFGVFSGRTINHIANALPQHTVYGFDSFEGLPETWRSDFTQGTFRVQKLPEVLDNVKLIKGWFEHALPAFFNEIDCNNSVGFVHIDCDLYSSTMTVLNYLRGRLKNGAVLVFDEFFNYPGWQNHEYRALKEFLDDTGYCIEFLASNPHHQQVAIKLFTENDSDSRDKLNGL